VPGDIMPPVNSRTFERATIVDGHLSARWDKSILFCISMLHPEKIKQATTVIWYGLLNPIIQDKVNTTY